MEMDLAACSFHGRRAAIRLIAAAWTLVAFSAVQAQSLDIPVLAAPPELADFTSMEPSDAVRARYAVVSGFMQRSPQDGAPSIQRTDVYLAYDSSNLYAVFVAFDSEPDNVRANLAPRENIDYDDWIGLLVDTFNDQRTAYAFRSSPVGVQWDARWSEVSKGASFDRSYEAVWYTDAQKTAGGYVVKMTIPFRAMRFPEDGEQLWRIQFERWIPRLSEESFWPAYSQSLDGRLNQAATLAGVRDVSPGRNMQLIPFAFVRNFDALNAALPSGPAFDDDTEDDIGLDAKFVLRDSFVLDLTYNPDFSQVESDQPQVTVNQRFEVQFPERRPFFLENADYFTTETPLVFTRRIVDPEAGLKFTGRQGPWGFGTMLIDDEAPGTLVAPTNPLSGDAADIGVLRLFRDIGDQSRAGVLYTEREFGDTYNHVGAFDTRVKLTDNWSTELLMVNTDTRSSTGAAFSGRQTNWRFDRNGRHALVHAHWTQQSDGFATQLGILGRNYQPDSKGLHGNVEYRFWLPEGSWLDRIGPRVFHAHQDDQSGQRIYAELSPALQMAWAGDSNLSIGTNNIRERLRPRDFFGLVEARDYKQERWYTEFWTEMFARAGFYIRYDTGTVINLVPAIGALPELADRDYFETEIRFRPSQRLRIDTNYLFTHLDDRGGGGEIFENRILRTRWNYQFTKEMSVRFIAQLEETDPTALTRLERDRNLNFDVLFRYVLNPWSALYVGYNTNRSNFQIVELDTPNGSGQMRELVPTDDLARDGSQLFVKFSYLLQR
jgi:hypothetical protein